MQNFVNKFENLSLEVLLKIFNYLSIEQCFYAFSNLNFHFNSALKLANYSVNLTSISSQIYTHFYDQLILPNYSQSVRKLRLSNCLTLNLLDRFFNDYYLEDFCQLRSLTLINPSYMTLGSFAWIISQLVQLEHLAVDAHACPSNFFRLITTTCPSLKFCYLPRLELNDEITFQSNIQSLTITITDITILLNLLAVFSKLKYLHISLKSTLYVENDDLPQINHITCENLENFKINILDRSHINFNEIEYFFQQITFIKLHSFSYNCITNSLNHLNVVHWNEILQEYLPNIRNLNLFVQIPVHSYALNDIKHIQSELQTKFSYSTNFSLSIDSSSYIIYTNNYPKKHYNLTEINEDFDLNPSKFSKINSLSLDTQICTILPSNIQHLQIQSSTTDLNLHYLLQDCSKHLISLKLIGLPDHLPVLPHLSELTIQRVMFDLSMAKKLSTLCPQLQLLTFEIDCLKQLDDILDQLRYKSNLTQLKFLRIFSRDANQTWSSWIEERNDFVQNINYEVINLFLFLWL